jgi:hypothetical protein
MYGLERDAWARLGDYYRAAGLVAEDPFSALDASAVAPTVEDAIAILRDAGATGPIFLCGEPANGPTAHAIATRRTGVFVSVTGADWPSTVLSCARQNARLASGPCLDRQAGMGFTRELVARAAAASRAGRPGLATIAALDWFSAACPLVGDDATRNWKILKKWLVAACFGELKGRFFTQGWDTRAVARYVRELLAGTEMIRISAFPAGISCHARSEVFDRAWDDGQLEAFLGSFDPCSALHVFPQQDADQLCFRAVCTQGRLLVEAGWGQAMYVFEAERGSHPIAVARAGIEGVFKTEPAPAVPLRVTEGLGALLTAQGEWLRGVARAMPYLLGLEQFAIEGYFDPRAPGKVAVVDIDLPLDIAWNTPS